MPRSSRGPVEPAPAGPRLARLASEHLEAVLRIERQSFASPWQRDHFLHELRRNPHALNRVALAGGIVVGYACCWILQDELTINNVAVHPDWRRKGVGRRLLRDVLQHAVDAHCKTAVLEVRPSNRGAIQLYAAEGFVAVGRRANYYAAEGEDAIRMQLNLVARSSDEGV